MKTLLLGTCLLTGLLSGQTNEKRWNVGVHGGLTQYRGELGRDFYRFNNGIYPHGGISVSRYLTPHLDLTALYTRGTIGHIQPDKPEVTSGFLDFKARVSTVSLLLKYNFLDPAMRLRPYLFIGGGLMFQRSISPEFSGNNNTFDFSMPAVGAGVNYRLTDLFSLQLQEMLVHSSTDDIDSRAGGLNDMYLFHTLGVTFNFGSSKYAKRGSGDKIAECPKIAKSGRTKVKRNNDIKIKDRESTRSPKMGRKEKKKIIG